MDDGLILRRLAQLAQTAEEAAALAEHDAATLRSAVHSSTEALRSAAKFLSRDMEEAATLGRNARGRSAGARSATRASRPRYDADLPSPLLDLEKEISRVSTAATALELFVRESSALEPLAGCAGGRRGPSHSSTLWGVDRPPRVSEAELVSARKIAQLQAAYTTPSGPLAMRRPFVLPLRGVSAGSSGAAASMPAPPLRLMAEARSAEESIARRAAAVRNYAERQVALVGAAVQAQTHARARLFETVQQRVMELLQADTRERLASACGASRARWTAALKRAALDAIAQISLWVDQAEAAADAEAAALLEQAQLDFSAAGERFKADALAAARRDCMATLHAQEASLHRQQEAATAAAVRAVEAESRGQLDAQLATDAARHRAELDRTITALRQRLAAEADAALAAAAARAAADRDRHLQEAEASIRSELSRREEVETSRAAADLQADIVAMQQSLAAESAERLQDQVRPESESTGVMYT